MARAIRSPLADRTNRLKLKPRKKPHHYTSIAPGVSLAAARRERGPCRWVVRVAMGRGKPWEKVLPDCYADDYENADGERVLGWVQAQDRARKFARGGDGAGAPMTWDEAIDHYEADLKARGGQARNATRLRKTVPENLRCKYVMALTPLELRKWRDSLLARGLQPASVVRECKPAIASLNLAKSLDPKRIRNEDAWKVGLKMLPDSRKARVQAFEDDVICAMVAACYAKVPPDQSDFALFHEVLAITGARPIQVARIDVGDLQRDHVMLPRTAKGKGKKKIDRRPFPLPADMVKKLKAVAAGRADNEPLLRREDGERLVATHKRFGEILKAAGLPAATPYSLRHSSITRHLKGGTPAAIVADAHDTSIEEIEATYGSLVADHADEMLRRNLIKLNLDKPERRSAAA